MIKSKMKKFSLKIFPAIIFAILINQFEVYSQGISINVNGDPPDSSAILDINATDQGILIPRVALTGSSSAAPVTNPDTSLLIYNTATVSDVTPGFYYWDGSEWTRLNTGSGGGGGSSHYIGELYGGGMIYYLLDNNQHGLIVSLDYIDGGTGGVWDPTSIDIVAGNGAASPLYGYDNTDAIVTQAGAAAVGPKLCWDDVTGGYTDWYLPGIWELETMYDQIITINRILDNDGNPATNGLTFNEKHWSSTERSATTAYFIVFNTYAYTAGMAKTNAFRIRCVRYF